MEEELYKLFVIFVSRPTCTVLKLAIMIILQIFAYQSTRQIESKVLKSRFRGPLQEITVDTEVEQKTTNLDVARFILFFPPLPRNQERACFLMQCI